MANSSNIKILLAYDGTAYLGWQKTQEGPSVEASLEAVLKQILQEHIVLQAASRTDAGVHAQGQVVNFFIQKENVDLNRLIHSANSLLPKDIVIREVTFAPLSFHPTLDCTGKEYHYSICYDSTQLPQNRLYSWHCPHALDLATMHQAGKILTGTHDFSAFCNVKKNESYENHIREVNFIDVVEIDEKRLQIIVSGNHFLYKMVRNLVGTMVYVAQGKISLEALPRILASRDRTQAGITAPAHGLTLLKVLYG